MLKVTHIVSSNFERLKGMFTCDPLSMSTVSMSNVERAPIAASTTPGFLWSKQETKGNRALADKRQNVSFAEHTPECTGQRPTIGGGFWKQANFQTPLAGRSSG